MISVKQITLLSSGYTEVRNAQLAKDHLGFFCRSKDAVLFMYDIAYFLTKDLGNARL
jgi:hypothetical protein